MKQLLVLGSVAALAVTSLHLDPPQAARTSDNWMRVQGEPAQQGKATPAAALAWRAARLPAQASSRLTLDALAPSRIKALHQRNAQAVAKPMQTGVMRDTALESIQKGLPALQWARTADGGSATRLVITSTGAKGLRVGLQLVAIDPRVELRFAGVDEKVVHRINGRDAAMLSDGKGVYWTPSTEGQVQIVEIYVPAGVKTSGVRVRVPKISHLLATNGTGFKFEKDVGDSGACNVDTICRVNELGQNYVNAKNAVAQMVFSDDTGTYICTGTLLADTVTATQVPYFYGANHCIENQAVASTLETYWRFESTSCGSGVAAARVPLYGGATYLYSNYDTDALLLRLNQAPPSGAFFAGWDSTPMATGAAATAIHHPSGDLKKVSLGQKLGQDDYLHTLAWTSGTTEGGSSGSGVFTHNSSGYYLRGGLYGGDASCANTGNVNNVGNRDYYSRFDVVFPHIRNHLSPPLPTTPTARDFNFDGQADVFWRNSGTGGNDIWRSANAALRQPTPSVALAWQVVGVGDFNADSKADVLWRNASTGGMDIWLSALNTTRQPIQAEPNLAWRVAGVGDFNGDGRADIFWRNASTGGTAYWPSANRSLSITQATVADQNWQVAGVGDFNNDNRDDVLWRNNVTGGNDLWRSGTAAQRQGLPAVVVAWKIVGVGDFNKDGVSDILWRNSSTGANAIWRSANSGTQQAVSPVTDQNWKVAQVADFDGDGYADIFWRNSATGHNDLWKGALSSRRVVLARVQDLNWKVIP